MNKENTNLQKYLEKLSNNLYDVVASLCIFKTIGENVEDGDSFYWYVQKTMLTNTVLSLSKIFDTSKQSITINKINNYIESNSRDLPLNERSIESRAKDFTYFKKDELLEISSTAQLSIYLKSQYEQILKLYQDDLMAIKELRDKHIAHQDTKEITNYTTWRKIDELNVFISEYIDLIYGHL
jgi:hypothetical protein